MGQPTLNAAPRSYPRSCGEGRQRIYTRIAHKHARNNPHKSPCEAFVNSLLPVTPATISTVTTYLHVVNPQLTKTCCTDFSPQTHELW